MTATETMNRLVRAMRSLYVQTGVDPQHFHIVMHPDRWSALEDELGPPVVATKGLEFRLFGQRVELDDDVHENNLILRAEVFA